VLVGKKGGKCGMKQGTDKIDETRGEGQEERQMPESAALTHLVIT
jgi:hypothetical protein